MRTLSAAPSGLRPYNHWFCGFATPRVNDKPQRNSCYGWAAAFFVVVALWISAIDFDNPSLLAFLTPCGETVEMNLLSPDAERRAVVYTAGCGAAGGLPSQGVSVLWDHQEVEYAQPFNTLRTQYGDPIRVSWRGSDTLEVAVPAFVLADASTSLIVDRIQGVDVIYRDSLASEP